MDRPQLFTFLLFASFLVIVFRFLERSNDLQPLQTNKHDCRLDPAMQLGSFVVNLHGAAALSASASWASTLAAFV